MKLDELHSNVKPDANYKQRIVLIAFSAFGVSLLLSWFGITINQRITQVDEQWAVYSERAASKAHALNNIQQSFGYGGFIHNFKNYVLRQDSALLPRIEISLRKTRGAIEAYAGLLLSAEELRAIAAVSAVVEAYALNVPLAQQLVLQGVSVQALDSQVLVDDDAALAAIAYLNKQVQLGTVEQAEKTDNYLAKTLDIFTWGWLLLPLFLAGALILVFCLRAIIRYNRRLYATTDFLLDLFEAAPDAMLLISAEGMILSANSRAVLIFGYSREEFKAMPVIQLMPTKFRGGHKKLMQSSFHNPKTRELTSSKNTGFWALTKDGVEIPVDISISYTRYSGAAVAISTLRDISSRKKAERELQLADNVFKHTSEAVMLMDVENKILRVNSAFTHITGYSSEEALGQDPWRLLNSPSKSSLEFQRQISGALDFKGYWEGERDDLRKDGELYPGSHSISVVKNDAGDIIQYISIFSDITEKKRAEAHILNLAQFDQLTGLANRVLFTERLENVIARSLQSNTNSGLMFLDLDGFKGVNDTLGHPVGDQLLQIVSERLLGCIRVEDTLARLGGDEFTVILDGLSCTDDAESVAQSLLKALEEPFQLNGQQIVIGASIGICIYPTDGESPEELIKNADMAMYEAKRQGRNRSVFYSHEFAQKAENSFHMERKLRQALDKGELEIFYQPQIDWRQGKMIGAEALIRWNDPEQGLVMPDDFMPLAVETGLIQAIGNWTLENVCLQAKAWQDEGFTPLRISVNVAGQQITQGSIVNAVKSALEKSGLAAEYLELEITEGFVMEDPEQEMATLNELRALGVLLAIDDFGTGYSSLSYLTRLSIDRLKIDRSFIRDIPFNKDDEAIATTIIAMANSLGLSVIAEGVESAEHIKFLCGQGCCEMQGYYFGKPMPKDQFSALFDSSAWTGILGKNNCISLECAEQRMLSVR